MHVEHELCNSCVSLVPTLQSSTRIICVLLLCCSTYSSHAYPLKPIVVYWTIFILLCASKTPVPLECFVSVLHLKISLPNWSSKLCPRSTTQPYWPTELTSNDKNEIQSGSVTPTEPCASSLIFCPSFRSNLEVSCCYWNCIFPQVLPLQ